MQGSGAPQHAVARPGSRDVTLALGRHDRAVRKREHSPKPPCRIRQRAAPAAAPSNAGITLPSNTSAPVRSIVSMALASQSGGAAISSSMKAI